MWNKVRCVIFGWFDDSMSYQASAGDSICSLTLLNLIVRKQNVPGKSTLLYSNKLVNSIVSLFLVIYHRNILISYVCIITLYTKKNPLVVILKQNGKFAYFFIASLLDYSFHTFAIFSQCIIENTLINKVLESKHFQCRHVFAESEYPQ